MANNITIGTICTPNPGLYVNMDTLGISPVEYLIQTPAPGFNWLYVNQFCSLLTTYWLNDPNSPNVYGIQNLIDPVKVSSAQQLINLLSLDEQVAEAKNTIANATVVTSAAFNMAVVDYPVGTKIWAGNNVHVVGFLITVAGAAGTGANGTYTAYDSNSGVAQLGLPLSGLAQLVTMMSYSSFVVGQPA